jgi:hypothetical protein
MAACREELGKTMWIIEFLNQKKIQKPCFINHEYQQQLLHDIIEALLLRVRR